PLAEVIERLGQIAGVPLCRSLEATPSGQFRRDTQRLDGRCWTCPEPVLGDREIVQGHRYGVRAVVAIGIEGLASNLPQILYGAQIAQPAAGGRGVRPCPEGLVVQIESIKERQCLLAPFERFSIVT